MNIGGTSTISNLTANIVGNNVNYTGTGQTLNLTSYYNLNLSGGAETFGSITTIGGDLNLSGTATATTGANLTISGNLSIGDATTFTVAGYNISVNGTTTIGGGATGTLAISSATGTKTFTGLVTLNSGATWNNSGNSAVIFQGGITNNGTLTAGSGVYTFNTNAQTLNGTLSIPSVTVAGVTLTNNNTLTVSTALAGTGGLTQAVNSNLNLNFTGSVGISNLTATASGNIVSYGYAGNQTIFMVPYFNLTITNSGTKSFASALSVTNNFSIDNGVVADLGTIKTHSVYYLILGGSGQTSGTWGSSSSTATNTNDTYFAPTIGYLTEYGCPGTWAGTTSTDWATASNWCDGNVPTSSISVTILSTAPNQPIIGAAATCKSLTINLGSTLTITGSNTLTLGGNFVNNGTFVPNKSTHL